MAAAVVAVVAAKPSAAADAAAASWCWLPAADCRCCSDVVISGLEICCKRLAAVSVKTIRRLEIC